MPYDDNHAECPCCQKIAEGKGQIEKLFGYRNMGVEALFLNHIVVTVALRIVRVVNHARSANNYYL